MSRRCASFLTVAALAVAALMSREPTVISGVEWADVSFPGFFRLLRRLGAEVEIFP